jgi:hypothetical protein
MPPPRKPGVRGTVRVHSQADYEAYKREAALRGESLADYLGRRLAATHHLPIAADPAPQLPLGGSWRGDSLAVTTRLRGLLDFWEHHPEIHDEVRQRAMRIAAQEEARGVA